MHGLKNGKVSQAGRHSIGTMPKRTMRLDNSPDPYQKRTFFISEPSGVLYDQVRGGFQRKNLLRGGGE